ILEKTWTKESLFNKAMELKPPEEENIPPFLPIRGFYVSEKERQEDLEEMKRSMDRSFQRDMEQMRRTHEANLEAAFAQWYKKA
ncbi:MAG: hypothetical protein KDK63_03485, partial [Chlamydiia bacterium]|nr:hypothetical protein [Chlamydiia bacterium]